MCNQWAKNIWKTLQKKNRVFRLIDDKLQNVVCQAESSERKKKLSKKTKKERRSSPMGFLELLMGCLSDYASSINELLLNIRDLFINLL